jgi:hypothetical protein
MERKPKRVGPARRPLVAWIARTINFYERGVFTSINGVVVTWVVAIDPPGVRFPLNAMGFLPLLKSSFSSFMAVASPRLRRPRFPETQAVSRRYKRTLYWTPHRYTPPYTQILSSPSGDHALRRPRTRLTTSTAAPNAAHAARAGSLARACHGRPRSGRDARHACRAQSVVAGRPAEDGAGAGGAQCCGRSPALHRCVLDQHFIWRGRRRSCARRVRAALAARRRVQSARPVSARGRPAARLRTGSVRARD